MFARAPVFPTTRTLFATSTSALGTLVQRGKKTQKNTHTTSCLAMHPFSFPPHHPSIKQVWRPRTQGARDGVDRSQSAISAAIAPTSMPGGARTNRPLPLPQKGHAYATHAVHAPTTVEHPDGHATKAASQLLPATVGRVAHATFTVPYRATVCQVIGVLSFSGFLGHILFIFLVAASLSLSPLYPDISRHRGQWRAVCPVHTRRSRCRIGRSGT